MAIVNDQPRGQTNVEAPLDTIKQGLREVQGEGGSSIGNEQVVSLLQELIAVVQNKNLSIDGKRLNNELNQISTQQGIQNISPNFAFGGR